MRRRRECEGCGQRFSTYERPIRWTSSADCLPLPSNADPSLQAERLQAAADLAWQQHDFETAVTYSTQAVELGRKHGLKGKYAAYINRLGRIYIEQGRYAEAKQALQEGLELAYKEPGNMDPGIPMAQLGEVAFLEGRLVEAKSLLQAALSQPMGADKAIFSALAKTALAETALAEGIFEQAFVWLKEAYPPASLQARRFIVFLCALAGYLVLSGSDKSDLRTAAQLYGVIEKLGTQSGVGFNLFYQKLNQERMSLAWKRVSAKE